MKKLLLFLFISFGLNAQFNYQAIVKDSNGNLVTNNQVKFKFSLMYLSSTASPVYVEEHTVTTPPDGVNNLTVGGGTVVNGTFSNIDWSQSVFMKEELDTGSGYQDMGTRKVASVPVAEYAKRVAVSDNFSQLMNKLDWMGFFVPFGVNDSGFVQSMMGGTDLAIQGGFTLLYDLTTNQINIPDLANWSYPLDEQYRIEDENGVKVELTKEDRLNENNQVIGLNWVASIPQGASKVRFLYKYSTSPPQLFTTPFIELKQGYDKFFANYSGETSYYDSNISISGGTSSTTTATSTTTTSTTESNTGIYLADNGVTIKCENASVGVTSTINDKVYTVVDEASLRAMVANDEDVTCVCTSLVSDTSELFLNKGSFNQDIGSWDTSNVTNMYGMFADAVSFNKSLNYWDVSNVTTMELMFVRASSFNSEIGNWNTERLTNMKSLFLSASAFNQDVGQWNTSNVTNMYGVFNKARAFNQDISSWDTSNVTNMRYLFQEAEQFNQDISGWDTSNVTDMRETFNYALSFDQDLSRWCVTKITALPQAFDDNTPMNLDWMNKRPVWGTCPP